MKAADCLSYNTPTWVSRRIDKLIVTHVIYSGSSTCC